MCSCPERPKCEWDWCDEPADWSVYQPQWGSRPQRFKLMCDEHYGWYCEKIPGIDRPDGADEYWRSSLADSLRFGMIKTAFEDRQNGRKPLAIEDTGYKRKYTFEQLKQIVQSRHR